VVLSVRLDDRLSLHKAMLDASSDAPRVLGVGTNFTNNRWWLRLEPHAAGTATVTLTAKDERGSRSQPVNFAVTVNPTFQAPELVPVGSVTLAEGEAPTNIAIGLKVDPRLKVGQAHMTAATDQPGVVTATIRLEQGSWHLELAPQTAGAAMVSLAATDERGLASRPVSVNVSVADNPKPPVSERTTNTAVMADAGSRLQQLSEELEILAVRFNVIRPTSAKTDRGRTTKQISGQIDGADMKAYLAQVDQLEQAFKAIGQVPPISLKRLRSQIRNFAY
jgi:hypothetical protein